MKRLYQLFSGCLVAGVIVSSCSGGGGSSSPTPSTVQQPGAPNANGTAPPAAASQTVYGTATLSITLPKVFTAKNVSGTARRAGASASGRTPSYVNPSTNSIIDVYVNGTLTGGLPTVQTTSGAQTLSIPLYSQYLDYIDVFEWDSSSRTNLLALGETTVSSFVIGSAVNASVTLLQNTAYIGVLDLYYQADPATMTGQAYTGISSACGSGTPSEGQLGFYSADALGTFVAAAGYGGTATPAISSTPMTGSNSVLAQTSIAGVYQVNFDNNCGGLTIFATATNPASAITNSALSTSATNYAGGNSYYQYYYCYYGDDPCPGGPYQGFWNMYWRYNESGPLTHVNGTTINGSLIIPSPAPSGSP